jgi:hypothetical protein
MKFVWEAGSADYFIPNASLFYPTLLQATSLGVYW